MLKLHHTFLATACLTLASVAGFAPSALAASNCAGQENCNGGPYTFNLKTDVFGGGSSLVAPYWRQTADCYANPAALIFKGTPPTFVDETFFDYTGTSPQNCATTHIKTGETVWYISTGSGTGIAGVFSHDPTLYGFVDGGQTQHFPEVHYGLSDAGLAASDVTIYNSGGTEQGVTVAQVNQESCTSGDKSPYPNPLQCYGPLVQYPFSIDPVTLFYANNGTYEKWIDTNNVETDYHFNVQNQRGDGSGGLRLSPTTYCKIWNGQITNWNDPAITTDNGGVSLVDPNDPAKGNWSIPIIPVGRSDSSGTTSIATRHWANVCASLNGNQFTTGATTLQAAGSKIVNATVYNLNNPNFPGFDIVGEISTAPGSNGVTQYAAFTASPVGQSSNCSNPPAGAAVCIQQGRLGYVGPDYVLPYVTSTQTNPYNLFSATLQNSNGNWEAPTPSGALAAFGSIQPPQSNKNGTYCPSCNNWGMRNDPSAWVQGLSPTSVLANPTAKTAYPMVGTTNLLGYTCYAHAKPEKTLVGMQLYLNKKPINNDPTGGILASAGLSPLPKQWRAAINGTFATNGSGLGLNFAVVGSPGACSVSGVVGG